MKSSFMHLQIHLVSDFEISLITVKTKVLMDGNNASLEISRTLVLMSTIVTFENIIIPLTGLYVCDDLCCFFPCGRNSHKQN